jgi:oligoendopeptidase F
MKNFNSFAKTIIMAFLFINYNQASFSQAEGGKLMSRDKIDPKYTWNLKDIYATDELWEKDFKWVEDNIPNYKKHEGKLGNSANELLAAAKFDDSMSIKLERLYLYASCSKDLDLSNSVSLARHDRINQLGSKIAVAGSFIRPELLAISKEKINKFLEESEGLRVYKHQIEDLFRSKEHTLPKEQEEILARSSEINQIPENTFSVFTNAEMKFATVKGPDGKDVQLSAGRYRATMYSSDRAYRERVYKGYLASYIDFKNTLATLFNGEIKTHIFSAQSRKFNSCLDAALNDNNIPVSVYKNLVKTANDNLAPLYRWRKIRKQVLGLPDYHRYDDMVTLFPSVKKEYSYDQAVEIVKEALKPLGADYIKNLTTAFDNRWVDVYETKGKRSGAYSSGVSFGIHPYVLLNWNNQLDDVFTLAHEMGHNMHSFYTEKNQPFPYANYSIFVAEVASTCNEALLLDYLIKKAETKDEKLALIEKYIMDIVFTFYRQAMFAEFELAAHEKAEKGEALTAESLTQLFKEISLKYWSADMADDDEEAYNWSRIPHFYMNFYVYQYATSFAASQVIAEKIITEKQPAIDKYLKFLKSGSSDYPIAILKEAGVDMGSPEPVLGTINKMNELLDQMEKLLTEK